MCPWLDHRALLILVSAGRSKGRQAIHVQFHTDTWIQTFVMGSKRSLVASSYQAPGSLSREGNRTSLSVSGGIKSSHAHSHNGEDPHVPPSKRRTACKWDTQQCNYQQQTPPGPRRWCPCLLQWND